MRGEVRNGFYIGSAFNIPKVEADGEINKERYYETFDFHFNIGTAENHCKPAATSIGYTGVPANDFDLTECLLHYDKTVENGQKFRGHTLVWHESVPAWLENGLDNGSISDTQLEDIMKYHIKHVM